MGLIGKMLPSKPYYLSRLGEEPEFAVNRLLYDKFCDPIKCMTSVCYIEDCEIIAEKLNAVL